MALKITFILLIWVPGFLLAGNPVFLEAEKSFTTESDGWRILKNNQTRRASAITCLNGATGDPKGVAFTKPISLERSDLNLPVRVWVRYGYHSRFRGPFRVDALDGDVELAGKDFDINPKQGNRDWDYIWDYFDVRTQSPFALRLSKYQNKNCTGYARNIDCFFITDDFDAVPDHIKYGPQTWLRIKLSHIYEKPLHIHIFADHHRHPWYSHWHISKRGVAKGLAPSKEDLLRGAEVSPWCNITPMIYQDTGAILNISARYTYHDRADRLKATFEFSTAPTAGAIVRTMDVDSSPNGLVVAMPPNLETEENLKRFKRDKEFAEATGKIADNFDWPTIGKKPEQFPFFVSASLGGYGTPVDQSIRDREQKTLDYYGFWDRDKHVLHGRIWRMKNSSYCQPDFDYMKKTIQIHKAEFKKKGHDVKDLVYCALTDEPTGQATAFMASDPSYQKAFRDWLKNRLGKSLRDLEAAQWEDVNPVKEADRDALPILYYFTQKFRTRALGDFMAVQRRMVEKGYNISNLPTLANFSDGATYGANFYLQGVDYFELLDSEDQNAIWSEDWANGASSYQCGAYNVDLQRAAARDRKQVIGHYLIAYAGRKSWDIKTKAAGETARGVKMWCNFSYGTSWGVHEGGPSWKSHAWYNKPEIWKANAEVVREIGGAEDLLCDALAQPAEVAIVYSTSSDIWTVKRNHAYGFNRMHTWMALSHAQIPVDFVAERQIDKGQLKGRKVCFLSGPNLTRSSAEKLREWVRGGGVLVLSAGAGMRDEFNRPLDIISSMIPAERRPIQLGRAFLNSGKYLPILPEMDRVKGNGVEMEVLSIRQELVPDEHYEVLATFSDGSPALVRGNYGNGKVYSAGFLPALDYIKQALVARQMREAASEKEALESAKVQGDNPAPTVELVEQNTTPNIDLRIERSYNPWEFSPEVRDFLLFPIREANINLPLTCSVPLVDAVVMESKHGFVMPLANHTLVPQERVRFTVSTGKRSTQKVISIHQGNLSFETDGSGTISFTLPMLEASDYLKIIFN